MVDRAYKRCVMAFGASKLSTAGAHLSQIRASTRSGRDRQAENLYLDRRMMRHDGCANTKFHPGKADDGRGVF